MLKPFLRNQTTPGRSFPLKTKITQSDLWVCFEARGQGISAGEFHWQSQGSELSLFRVGPQVTFSAGFFSLCSHSVPPGRNPCCPARKEDAGCQQRQGLGARITVIPSFHDDFSTDFHFLLVPTPNLTPVLCCIMWLCSESFWFHTSGGKKPSRQCK